MNVSMKTMNVCRMINEYHALSGALPSVAPFQGADIWDYLLPGVTLRGPHPLSHGVTVTAPTSPGV